MENKEPKDPILAEIEKLDGNVKWVLVIAIPFLLLMPILTTQLDWFFDFTKTGNIGDTIGGITAPVIGVVSALLIYFSFRAQVNANRIIQNQITEQKKEDIVKKEQEVQITIYREIKDAIDNFRLEKQSGIEAIHTYFSYLLIPDIPKLIERHFIVENIFLLIDELTTRINDSNRNGVDSYLAFVLIDFLYSQILSKRSLILFKYESKDHLSHDFPVFKEEKIEALLSLAYKLRSIDVKISAIQVFYNQDKPKDQS